MNVFRLCGDVSHLLAMIMLLVQILKIKSCAGLSGKSQVFYLLVFLTRYADIFTTFYSVYVTVVKVIFVLLTALTVYLIYGKFKKSYDEKNEPKCVELVILPCAALALMVNHQFTFLEFLWTFSVYLESVAILPQLFMISKTGKAETITVYYLLFLGIYRALYIVNWVYRYCHGGYFDAIAICAGIVQTVLYCDFFYVYFTRSSLDTFEKVDAKMVITNI